MPLKIKKGSSYSVFDTVRFIDSPNPQFEISNSLDDQDSFLLDYIPKLPPKKWNPKSVDIFLLDSEYQNAENDIFPILDNITGERMGWIFPIAALESDDNDYYNKDNFNFYRLAAYEILLNMDFEIYSLPTKISDIYKDKIICIFHKETIKRLDSEFNINSYLLSLYKYGYLYSPSITLKEKKEKKFRNLFLETESFKTIKLIKSKFDISSDFFIESLFKNEMINQENILIRFVFLYQTIELFMNMDFERHFDKYLKDFGESSISKNDLREKIADWRERKAIQSIIENSYINMKWKTMFEDSHKNLCSLISRNPENSFEKNLYQFRNIFTHEMRNILSYENELTEIIAIFEQIIIDILMSYPDKPI